MKTLAILMAVLFHATVAAQLQTYSFEEAETIASNKKRPYFIFLKTDWCRYCAIMERTTFDDPKVIDTLNANYYFIRFDAASRDAVHFNGINFNFKPTGTGTGLHEIVPWLLQDTPVAFPSIVILNPDYTARLIITEFLSAAQLLQLIGNSN